MAPSSPLRRSWPSLRRQSSTGAPSRRASRPRTPAPRASRDECLNEQLFFSKNHARAVVAGWIGDFNTAQPHSAIGYMR
ncbi:hypothetical protein CNY89_20555, partial [Amaricoccus sp. HAR-UPW-R2A-40]